MIERNLTDGTTLVKYLSKDIRKASMVNCTIEELKSLEPLTDVPEEQLQWLLDNGNCRRMVPGDIMFDIGDTFASTNFILSGKFSVSMQQGNQVNEVLITERGDINGYLPFSRGIVSIIRVVCISEATILQIAVNDIVQVTKLHYELTAALVHNMLSRVRFATTQQQQVEKMFALGKLSAGLAHELNNPAAAIVRNASSLSGLFDNIPELFKKSVELKMAPVQADEFRNTLERLLKRPHHELLTMMERSEREDELTTWLDEHGVEDYTLTEVLVNEEFELADLEHLGSIPTEQELKPAFAWLSYHLTTRKIVKEIGEASERISELVGAVKSFSHMDRGGDKQFTPIYTGLESTLTLLNYKIRNGHINVVRNFAQNLPPVKVFPGVLNQVWTNIIDNAVDAMAVNPNGVLTITLAQERQNLVVTINDNGPGIPAEISSRIFDPFFTTKEIGKGTGLGLDVVTRIISQHKGTIQLKSVPGSTSFIICIPINEN